MVNDKKKCLVKDNGFTLIELLVIVGIMAVTGSLGLFSYNTLSKEQTLSASTRKIIDVLNLTRKRAIAGDTSHGCTGSLEYYKFIKQSASQYAVIVKCTGSSETTVYTYTTVSNNAVEITSLNLMPAGTSLTGIKFSGLNGEISGDANAGDMNVTGTEYINLTVKSNSLNKCVTVTINSLGVISESEKVSC